MPRHSESAPVRKERRRSSPRRLFGAILSMLMIVVATHAMLSAGASAQAPPGCGVCEEGYIYGTTGFAGSYAIQTPSGTVGNTYCVTQGLNYPNSAHAGPVPTDYPDQPIWASLLAVAAATDEDKAAVSMRVHRDLEGNSIEWRANPDLQERSDELWGRAAALAGPFSISVDVSSAPSAANGGVGVVSIAVRSSAGLALPNATIALTGGNMALPTTASSGPTGVLELPFTVAAPGAWRIDASGQGLPAVSLLRYDALRSEQTVIGAGPASATPGAGASGSWDVPTRVTISKIDAASGAPLSGAVVQIRSAAAPQSPPSIVTTDIVPVVVALAPGDYSAVETSEPVGYLIDDPQARRFSVTLLGGEAALVWADTAATPVVSTTASAARVAGGGAVHDVVTVSGLPPSQPVFDLTLRYLGPVPAGADGDCEALAPAAFASAPVIGRTTLLINGDGSYPTAPFIAPLAAGCTTFEILPTAALWPGGPSLSAAPNGAQESVEVVAASIDTAISSAMLVGGAEVFDRVTIRDLPVWAGPRTLTVSLIGPIHPPRSGRCADLAAGAFDSAPVLASTTIEIDRAAAALGWIDTPAFAVPDLRGCVSFEVRDTAPLWSGGPILVSARGAAAETGEIRPTPPAPQSTPSQSTPSQSTPSESTFTGPSAPTPSSTSPSAQSAAPAPVPDAARLANTGPPRTGLLLAVGAELLFAGIGLMLLMPAPSAHSPRRRRR
jgi:hypothetical protein